MRTVHASIDHSEHIQSEATEETSGLAGQAASIASIEEMLFGHIKIVSFGVQKLQRLLPHNPKDCDLKSALCDVGIHNVALFVDVRNFPDPDAGNKGLHGHTGNHHSIISGIVKHPQFSKTLLLVKNWWKQTVKSPSYSDVAIAFYCKAGRHRSVAWASIVHHIFNSGIVESVEVFHQSFHDGHWKFLCTEKCAECCQKSDIRDKALELALSTWISL